MAVGIEDAPIGPESSLVGLPRLIEGLDDRVVDAHGVGAGDEVAHHLGLDKRARHGVLAIESRARPAEFGDHDALAGISLPKFLIGMQGMVNRDRSRQALPIGKDMHGDIVDRGGEFGIFEPNRWHLGGGDWDRYFALHPLNFANEIAHRIVGVVVRIVAVLRLRAEGRLVAGDDAFNVPIMLNERNGSLDLALVLLLPVVDPDTERYAQTVLRGKLRHEIEAVADAIGPYRARVGSDRR